MKSINVAAAIIQKDGKILSCQRGYGEFKDGWEFPGGKLEPGETPAQAAVEHDYATFHLSMQCYLANILSGEFKEHAHEDMKWLDTNNLWDVDWLPADVKVVKELEKKLGLK